MTRIVLTRRFNRRQRETASFWTNISSTPPRALPEHLAKYQRLMDKLIEKDRDARFRNTDEVIGFLSRKFYQGGNAPADKTQKLH